MKEPIREPRGWRASQDPQKTFVTGPKKREKSGNKAQEVFALLVRG